MDFTLLCVGTELKFGSGGGEYMDFVGGEKVLENTWHKILYIFALEMVIRSSSPAVYDFGLMEFYYDCNLTYIGTTLKICIGWILEVGSLKSGVMQGSSFFYLWIFLTMDVTKHNAFVQIANISVWFQ